MSDFVHLHVHTDYSLLDGAASIQKLVGRAKELGMKALAITDHGNMFGALRFWRECRAAGIKPIIGCEFYVAPESRTQRSGSESGNKYYHLVLLAKNEQGYRNLMVLTSRSYTEGMYYKPRIDEELIRQYSEGIVCLSACIAGELPTLLLDGKIAEAERFARKYREIFGAENYFIELQDHGIEEQRRAAPLLIDVARRLGIPLVVTNDIHYCNQEDYIAQDILLCIGTKRTRNEPNRMRFFGKEFYMKDEQEMARLFPDYPEMITNTARIADMCDLDIPLPGPLLPAYEIPPEFSDKVEYLKHLTYTGLEKRYETVTDEIRERAKFELDIIIRMDFVGYFLIVWDFINWAKEHHIPVGPGRGSGAGSIVAYAMRITDIDPLRYNLLFERFLNPERISMPDFDIDFCYEGRQDVIEYVREKYGDERVGQIITFGTMKAKAAIKDVARVLEIPLGEVTMITKMIPEDPKMTLQKAFDQEPRLVELRETPQYKELFDISFILENTNRNTSIHASGIVIGQHELTEYVPLYKDQKTGKTATQFTMDLIEDCGLVKMDFLGLKTLTLLKYAQNLIRNRGGEYADFDVEKVSETDPATYAMLGEGKSAAVFQFESQGMQNILKRAKPGKIEDLIALNALYRPGPMAFIDQFIESKFDNSKISYPDPCLKNILEETYGVIVYQEQVMQVAQRIAGYSLGQADLLRRAMGKKKHEVMIEEKDKFIKGAVERGFAAADADRIFEILVPFAGYGFNKSHAAAYSIVAYRTAYLKANFPAEFIAANLTNEISSVDKLPEYIAEGRKMGIPIDPPDINRSDKLFDVVEGRIVYGLMGIKGLGEAAAEEIINQRKSGGPYTGFMNFLDRVDLRTVNKKALEVLIQTGSFDNLGQFRSVLINNLERAVEYALHKKEAAMFGQVSLFEDAGEIEFAEFRFEEGEEWAVLEKLRIEKELIGFYISGHPLDNYRKACERSSTLDLRYLERAQKEKPYTIVGMVKSLRPRPTKTNKWMAFGTLEDFNGSIDLVFFPDLWEKQRDNIKDDSVWGLTGKIDMSRETPGFIVDAVINPDEMQEKSIKELHIRMLPGFSEEKELHRLRDILFESSGNCCVYFHIDTPQGLKTVKANHQMTVASSDELIESLAGVPVVESVWKE
ncbi:MAG: DNA polymerase III subunit alpha [Spirochaetaceae bacterium]|jgi:DNA polymerase-3 subunit alpha|nr:DNA polymerase III subunit alpha [Spirochaetaceae bacterium]